MGNTAFKIKVERLCFFVFGKFEKGKSGRIEENTEIRELDEFGQPKQKRSEQTGTHGGNSSGGGFAASMKAKLFGGLVVAFFAFLYFSGQMGDFIDMFSSTPEENMNAMFQGIRDVEKVNKQEGNLHPIYDKKNIYTSDNIFKQVDKQYVVYLYTEDETLDASFNAWVEEHRDTVPIYTLSTWQNTDLEIDKLVGSDPAFLIVYEHERDYKVLDSIVTDAASFDLIPETLETLKLYRQEKDK